MEQLLFISGDKRYRDIINNLLCGEYELKCSDSYASARAEAGDKRFDVVIFTVDSSAALSGLESFISDSRDGSADDIPFICLIPEEKTDLLSACLSLGVYDVVALPVNPSLLELRVARAAELGLCRRNVRLGLGDTIRNAATMFLYTMSGISDTIDAKDRFSVGHSMNTSAYSSAVGAALGWDSHRINALRYAAMLHDIGKLSVPEKITLKPAPLSDEEFELMRTHPVSGSELISAAATVSEIPRFVRHHHENFDGSGYPDGLSGDRIPEESMIIHVAGAYDTMISGRIYKAAMTSDEARAELLSRSGSQFDPRIVDAFLSVLERGVQPGSARIDFSEDALFRSENNPLLKYIIDEQSSVWRYAAERDYLTGLHNRRSGESRITRLLSHEDGALMMIDIDNFKQINDTYGHLAGDLALKQTAEIFKRCARGDDIVCRIGGDEYLIYLRHTTSPGTVGMIAARILDEYSLQAAGDETMAGTSLSIGITISTSDNHDFNVLLNEADKALYHIKQNGKANFCIFDLEKKNVSDIRPGSRADMEHLLSIIRNRSTENGVFRTDFRQFNRIYEFADHFARRNSQSMTIILLTLRSPLHMRSNPDRTEFAMRHLESAINLSLRGVDISSRYSSSQFVVVLMGSDRAGAEIACERISKAFYKLFGDNSPALDCMINTPDDDSAT